MTQPRGDITKDQILRQAEILFAKNGYDATGVSDICKAADISKGAFYYHFPTKHSLFMNTLENWLGNVDRTLARMAENRFSVPDQILGMVEIIPEIVQTGQSKLGILLEFWTKAKRDPEIWKTAVHPYRKYIDFFVDLLDRGVKEGSITPCDTKLLAQKLISIVLGVLFQAILVPDGADWRKVTSESIQDLLTGAGER